MEWDFTTKQVMKGEVDYDLEQFFEDLREEVDYNFNEVFEPDRLKNVAELFYRVMYFMTLGISVDDVTKKIGAKKEFVQVIIDLNEENLKMLVAIIQGLFLKNLQESGGYLSDSLNLRMVNAQMRKFHKKHKL